MQKGVYKRSAPAHKSTKERREGLTTLRKIYLKKGQECKIDCWVFCAIWMAIEEEEEDAVHG